MNSAARQSIDFTDFIDLLEQHNNDQYQQHSSNARALNFLTKKELIQRLKNINGLLLAIAQRLKTLKDQSVFSNDKGHVDVSSLAIRLTAWIINSHKQGILGIPSNIDSTLETIFNLFYQSIPNNACIPFQFFAVELNKQLADFKLQDELAKVTIEFNNRLLNSAYQTVQHQLLTITTQVFYTQKAQKAQKAQKESVHTIHELVDKIDQAISKTDAKQALAELVATKKKMDELISKFQEQGIGSTHDATGNLTRLEVYRIIQDKMRDKIRQFLKQDGGDLSLESINREIEAWTTGYEAMANAAHGKHVNKLADYLQRLEESRKAINDNLANQSADALSAQLPGIIALMSAQLNQGVPSSEQGKQFDQRVKKEQPPIPATAKPFALGGKIASKVTGFFKRRIDSLWEKMDSKLSDQSTEKELGDYIRHQVAALPQSNNFGAPRALARNGNTLCAIEPIPELNLTVPTVAKSTFLHGLLMIALKVTACKIQGNTNNKIANVIEELISKYKNQLAEQSFDKTATLRDTVITVFQLLTEQPANSDAIPALDGLLENAGQQICQQLRQRHENQSEKSLTLKPLPNKLTEVAGWSTFQCFLQVFSKQAQRVYRCPTALSGFPVTLEAVQQTIELRALAAISDQLPLLEQKKDTVITVEPQKRDTVIQIQPNTTTDAAVTLVKSSAEKPALSAEDKEDKSAKEQEQIRFNDFFASQGEQLAQKIADLKGHNPIDPRFIELIEGLFNTISQRALSQLVKIAKTTLDNDSAKQTLQEQLKTLKQILSSPWSLDATRMQEKQQQQQLLKNWLNLLAHPGADQTRFLDHLLDRAAEYDDALTLSFIVGTAAVLVYTGAGDALANAASAAVNQADAVIPEAIVALSNLTAEAQPVVQQLMALNATFNQLAQQVRYSTGGFLPFSFVQAGDYAVSPFIGVMALLSAGTSLAQAAQYQKGLQQTLDTMEETQHFPLLAGQFSAHAVDDLVHLFHSKQQQAQAVQPNGHCHESHAQQSLDEILATNIYYAYKQEGKVSIEEELQDIWSALTCHRQPDWSFASCFGCAPSATEQQQNISTPHLVMDWIMRGDLAVLSTLTSDHTRGGLIPLDNERHVRIRARRLSNFMRVYVENPIKAFLNVLPFGVPQQVLVNVIHLLDGRIASTEKVALAKERASEYSHKRAHDALFKLGNKQPVTGYAYQALKAMYSKAMADQLFQGQTLHPVPGSGWVDERMTAENKQVLQQCASEFVCSIEGIKRAYQQIMSLNLFCCGDKTSAWFRWLMGVSELFSAKGVEYHDCFSNLISPLTAGWQRAAEDQGTCQASAVDKLPNPSNVPKWVCALTHGYNIKKLLALHRLVNVALMKVLADHGMFSLSRGDGLSRGFRAVDKVAWAAALAFMAKDGGTGAFNKYFHLSGANPFLLNVGDALDTLDSPWVEAWMSYVSRECFNTTEGTRNLAQALVQNGLQACEDNLSSYMKHMNATLNHIDKIGYQALVQASDFLASQLKHEVYPALLSKADKTTITQPVPSSKDTTGSDWSNFLENAKQQASNILPTMKPTEQTQINNNRVAELENGLEELRNAIENKDINRAVTECLQVMQISSKHPSALRHCFQQQLLQGLHNPHPQQNSEPIPAY